MSFNQKPAVQSKRSSESTTGLQQRVEFRKTFWDTVWDKMPRDALTDTANYFDILSYVKGKNVLDVGCGSLMVATAIPRAAGFNSINIMYASNQYTGVDVSELAINSSNAMFPESKFVTADVTSLPFKDKSFDIAISMCALSYVGRDIKTALVEMDRVSSEGLIFNVYHELLCSGPLATAERCSHGIILNPGVKLESVGFNEDGMRLLMKEIGFSDDELFIKPYVINTNASQDQSSLSVMVKALRRKA